MIVPMSAGPPRAAAALRAGAPVVLPLPSPLPYGVAATSVAAVKRAKGRPAAQPAGVIVGDFGEVTPFLAVEPEVARMLTWMCTAERLNVFAPLREDAPSWMTQAEGYVGLMGSWLPDLRALLAAFGHLFISSANATTSPPAVTAPEADASFGGRLLVIDGDPARDPARRHGSATIVRISPDGALSLARHGVNDQSFPGTSEQYLTDRRRRYEHQP